MPSVASPAHIETELAFTRPEDVGPDPERPGVLRGPDVDPEGSGGREVALHRIGAEDLAALPDFRPDLVEHGFSRIDLSGLPELQTLFSKIRAAGELEPQQATRIRRALAGRSFPLGGGRRLKLLNVVSDGFIMRRAGPNGMRVHSDGPIRDAAQSVHADQDVGGTPLRQMMRGAAPWLFHHDSPQGRNRFSPLFLLNVWIPLEQVTRPLALMDRRSIDRRRHQLRLGLKVDSFLERDAGSAVNHIWSFLHDDAQRWYFTSELDATNAYVFETLSTPHASFVVPGEELAEARYRQLDEARAALDAGDEAALRSAGRGDRATLNDAITAPLRRAIEEMDALLDEAAAHSAALVGGESAEAWRSRARHAQQRVERKSLEMRGIGVVTPDVWPFRRG